MAEEPAPPPPSPQSGGKPGIFQNINTTIAGVTGLVIAVGGLAASWDKIFPPKAAAEPPAAAQQVAAPATAPTNSAAVEEAEPEAGDPTLYKGELVDGERLVTIEWDGENWVVTESGNDPWYYDETISPDETKVLAVSNGSYLRWPIDGGEVDESDDKIKWKTWARVDAQ